MAEDSNKEQLEIQAKLDTSQLQQDAQEGFNEVSNEAKKLEEQAKRVSNTIDDLGESLADIGGKSSESLSHVDSLGSSLVDLGRNGVESLREVGNEVDNTAQSLKDLGGTGVEVDAAGAAQSLGEISEEAERTAESLKNIEETSIDIHTDGMSEAVESLGEAITQVGENGSEALKQVGEEVDNAASKINESKAEAKQLDSQTKQTAKSANNLAASLSNAGNKGSQAFKQVGTEINNSTSEIKNAEAEEKKLEAQSIQTSKAIDEIGNSGKRTADSLQQTVEAGTKVGDSLQQAGRSGTQALKEVGKEAEKTVDKIDDIDKAVKNLKLGQAIGLAARFANSDIGKGLGSAVGDSLEMTESEKGVAGSALQGGLQGAAMGAMAAGPWGAVVGGLAGAATGLIQAAEEQKQAARELAKSGEQRADAILKENLRKELAKDREEEYNRVAANPYETVKGDWYENGEVKEVTAIQGAIDKTKWEIGGYEEEVKGAVEALERLNSIDISKMSKEDVTDWKADIEKEAKAYEEYSARLEDATKRLAAFEALQEQLNNLPVGPEIPDSIRVQREGEENLPVGPEIPEYLRIQRQAEEEGISRREQTVNEIRQNDRLKNEMSDLQGQVRNSSDEKYNQIRNGLVEAMKKAKDKMEQSTKNEDDFIKAQQELKDSEMKLAVVDKARKAKLQDDLQQSNEEKKGLAEELNKQLSIGKTRLSDSLTSIGGGSGYFAQNRGAVENIDKTLRTKLTSIDEQIKAIKDKMDGTGDTWN